MMRSNARPLASRPPLQDITHMVNNQPAPSSFPTTQSDCGLPVRTKKNGLLGRVHGGRVRKPKQDRKHKVTTATTPLHGPQQPDDTSLDEAGEPGAYECVLGCVSSHDHPYQLRRHYGEKHRLVICKKCFTLAGDAAVAPVQELAEKLESHTCLSYGILRRNFLNLQIEELLQKEWLNTPQTVAVSANADPPIPMFTDEDPEPVPPLQAGYEATWANFAYAEDNSLGQLPPASDLPSWCPNPGVHWPQNTF